MSIWNALTPWKKTAEIHRFKVRCSKHAHPMVYCCDFSPNNRVVAAAGWDTIIRFWDIESGKQVLQIEKNESSLHSLKFAPNGSLILSGGNHYVDLWGAQNGIHVDRFKGHMGTIYGLAFSPSRSWTASASGDGTVCLWGTSGLEHRWDKMQGKSGMTQVAFLSESDGVLIGGWDTLRKWYPLENFDTPIISYNHGAARMALSPDERYIIYSTGSSKHSGNVHIWDAVAKKEIRFYDGIAESISISPDSQRALLARGRSLWLLDLESGRLLQTFEGHKGDVNCVAFSANNRFAVSGSNDGTVRVWALT